MNNLNMTQIIVFFCKTYKESGGWEEGDGDLHPGEPGRRGGEGCGEGRGEGHAGGACGCPR